MMMIGRSSAEERLAWFLTMLSARSGEPCALALDLAMQRQDIADYLGLTIETVSRTFTLFRDRGFLRLPRKRRVEILRPDALARLAAADRDAVDPHRPGAGREPSWPPRPSDRLASPRVAKAHAARSRRRRERGGTVQRRRASRRALRAAIGHAWTRRPESRAKTRDCRRFLALCRRARRKSRRGMRPWDGWTTVDRLCIREFVASPGGHIWRPVGRP